MGSLFSPGAKEAKRAAALQEEQIGRQKQIEAARKAEAEDEIARRKSLAESGRAGRRALIKTSELGSAPRQSLG